MLVEMKAEDTNPRKSKWDDLFEAVGLPPLDGIDEATQPPTKRSLPIEEFRKLFKIRGRTVGTNYYDESAEPTWCLAGSAVLAWIVGGKTNDFDFFPRDIPSAQKLSTLLLSKKWWVNGYQGERAVMEEMFHDDWKPSPTNIEEWYVKIGDRVGKNLPHKINPLAEMPMEELVRAINFKKNGSPKMRQIVLLIRGTPIEVIDTFDFSISQWAIDGRRIYWGKYTLQDTARRRVRINRIHHPMSTMRRMLKYANRGYFFCNGTTLDISRALTYYADAREEAGLPLFDQPISLD